MNTSLKIIGVIAIIIATVIGIQFYISNKKIESSSYNLSDSLLIDKNLNYIIENLDQQSVLKEFSDQNFPDKTHVEQFISDISKKCNWREREGGLVDSYTTKNIDGVNQIAYIYEFKLKCDQLNFIITYKMGKEKPELFRFDFEPLTQQDQTITTSEKQLK